MPESQLVQTSDEMAWGVAEYVPGPHFTQDTPLVLYVPAAHALHVEAHEEQAAPDAILHDEVPLTHEMHLDMPARLPVDPGQAWHAVLPAKYEKVPAAQGEQEEEP